MSKKSDKKINIKKGISIGYTELTSFFYLVTDAATNALPEENIITDIRCFVNGCPGLIETSIDKVGDKLLWCCTVCGGAGAILHWKGSEWDNAK